MSLPDLKNLLETARRLQSEVARVREDLGRKTVTGETGGGLVRCVANGKGEVVSITIDPAISGETKMIEDLTTGAVNLALERARELAQAELGQATGGLPLPPGLFGS
ncbi:MAG TPA: YbaB/EbfC family nucleoid-associated protein [Polyangia bacterium]|nr:YbaB/EbfC family nucleoid-associated protein [Polyangia bacterium]